MKILSDVFKRSGNNSPYGAVEHRVGQYRIFLVLTGMLVALVCAVALVAATAAADSQEADDEVIIRLPVLMAGYFEGAVKDGISGRVTDKGAPSVKTTMHLRFNDGFEWSTTDNVVTDAAGRYIFANVQPLQSGQEYYVRYGPNTTDASKVYNWYGPSITDFSAGTRAFGGVFDIGDVPLISPASGAFARLPVMFSWQKRNLPGETYRIAVLDETDQVFWRTIELGDVNNFELNVLAPDMLYFRQYSWYIEVYAGEDSFGESYMLNDIVFLPPASSQQDGLAQGVSPLMRGSGRGGR